MSRHRNGWAPVVLAGALALGLAACGTTGGGDKSESILGSQPERARRLYAQLEREHSLERDRQALDLAHSLLDYYPDFVRNDEVRLLGMDSARRLGDTDAALALADELLAEHPDSPLVDQALLQAVELAAVTGDTLRACGYRIVHDDRHPAGAFAADGYPRAAELLDALDADQLAVLLERHPDGVLAPYVGFARTRALVMTDDFPAAQEQVEALEAGFPADAWTLAAREILTSPETSASRWRRPVSGVVSPDRIGLLASLTGRYAVLGNACVDASLLALEAARLETGRDFELQIEDTGGDPVIAALAARRLCSVDGSVALLGAVASSPTVATALVATEWGVPLVSPTATNDRVWELGRGVFQTNLTDDYEIRLLSRLVTRILLKRRCAILRPETPEGARQAAVFADEVTAQGGEIVREAVFDPRTADFRNPILELREVRPEVVFVPVSRDQMALVGPQLDFYRLGALVLGLSNLDDARLLERTGVVLEGVVFPNDLVLFPAEWTAEFQAAWDPEQYPAEAADLALKFYQGTRMLLDTLAVTGAENRAQLTQALQGRLASRGLDTEGPDSYAGAVQIVRAGKIVDFPVEIFSESWAMVEGARADSLAAAADSLGLMEFDEISVPE